MLKSSRVFLFTVVVFTTVLMAPTSFGADSELFCGCVVVGDDDAISLFADRCDDEATRNFYTRSTVRAPKSGEYYYDATYIDFEVGPCNVDINGTAGCQQLIVIDSPYDPKEPIACLGSGLRKKKAGG